MERIRALGHPLCAGLEPHLERIPPLFRAGTMDPASPETARAVERFCLAALDRYAGRVAVVKPQAAFFERLGAPGVAALEAVITAARERGLLVLLDAKRGDIGSTAAAYAAAWLGPGRADALTVNPYLGIDSLEPFVKTAEASGAGLFVLVRTSNPGARDFQGLDSAGRPVFEHVASALAPLCERLTAPRSGWSSLGVVVGATWPEESRRVRALLPRALFLVPGYGAQGASAADALAGFTAGPDGRLEGGLVNSSRALLFPPEAEAADTAGWERAVDAAVARAAEELAAAAQAGAGSAGPAS